MQHDPLLLFEDIDFSAEEFDVVISSLTFHYVEHFDIVCRKVHHCLVPRGTFVLSVEHPVFTALARKIGIMVSIGSDCIGLSTITRMKVCVRQDFWTMMWSNIIAPSPPI